MNILLHATGESEKLSPLTNHLPSPLLPVLNRPLMEYNLELLVRQQFKAVAASLHDNPGKIEAYFGDGKYRGASITYTLQKDAFGDAGAVKWAYPESSSPVLLLPADILIDIDFTRLIEFHKHSSAGISIVLARRKQQNSPPGLQVVDDRIVGIEPVSNNSADWLSTGVFVLSPEVIRLIPIRETCSMVGDLLPRLLELGVPAYAYKFSGYWNPIETFADYWKAQLEILQYGSKADSAVHPDPEPGFLHAEGHRISEGVWSGRNNRIHPSVKVAPRLYIHENTQLNKGVQVGPDVIISSNVIIDEGATIQKSLILDNTYVGRFVNIDSKLVYKNLIVDYSSGEYIRLTDEFLLAEAHREQLDRSFRRFFGWLFALALLILSSPFFIILLGLLALRGLPIFDYESCIHKDFRWFVPDDQRGYRTIRIFRFRTRKPDSTFALFGRFLEASHVYRWPELINVIRGDLALVGVKPLNKDRMPELDEDWKKTRFTVPMGVTGLWYLRTNEHSSLNEILISDAYYAATRNWKEDMTILLQTPLAWVKHFRRTGNKPVQNKEANLWN